ncbi:MAG TPA: FAD-dependent oxidoreductase [Turneriella sp.]|nr:FAD-dependent oxidoreductase [Turneriella sp.]
MASSPLSSDASDTKEDISRRTFFSGIVGLLAILMGFFWFRWQRKQVTARFVGPAVERGHLLRIEYKNNATGTSEKIDTAIIGGGVSGLSAAWYLNNHGYKNFALFELEDKVGGNASWGENRFSRYPWGAHYLPTPGKDATYVQELLREMGILKNGKYSEECLVHEVEERLFIYGIWQEGLKPLMGARAVDKKDFEAFRNLTQSYSKRKGSDGRPAFTIPLALSSRDPQLLALDRITATEFLASQGFTSQRLFWYIDYSLRDEYGSNRSNTSAWALIHYFAARGNMHNLVWPEGNGFLVEYMRSRVEPYIHTGKALRHIEKGTNDYALHFLDFASGQIRKVSAKNIIFSIPKFILSYLYPQLHAEKAAHTRAFTYSPWMTANFLVNHFDMENPAWDNVIYGSHSLGYVVAEHQKIGKLPHARTLTFFHAFDEDDTLQSRRRLLSMSERGALDFALRELEIPHPHIHDSIEEVGVYRWAHAMIRPIPGFITGNIARLFDTIDRNFYGAHSDLSGMSNFEEAQYRGVTAAKRILS